MPVFALGTDISPVEIVRQALAEAEKEHHDVVIIDTAGRLHVDEVLMQELKDIRDLSNSGRSIPCCRCDDRAGCCQCCAKLSMKLSALQALS